MFILFSSLGGVDGVFSAEMCQQKARECGLHLTSTEVQSLVLGGFKEAAEVGCLYQVDQTGDGELNEKIPKCKNCLKNYNVWITLMASTFSDIVQIKIQLHGVCVCSSRMDYFVLPGDQFLLFKKNHLADT